MAVLYKYHEMHSKLKVEKASIGVMPTCSEIFASAVRSKVVDRHRGSRVG